MSVKMLGWAWDVEAAPLTKFVLVTLADYANHDGGCFPSIGRLAQRTCMSERSVQRAVAELEANGVLTRQLGRDGRLWFYLNHNLPVVDVPKSSRETAPTWLRAEVLAASELKCYWCQAEGTESFGPDLKPWTMDRLTPGRHGGKYVAGNVVLACRACNTRKGTTDPDAFRAKMGGDGQAPVKKAGVTEGHTGVTESHRGGDGQAPHGVTGRHPIRKREPSDEPSDEPGGGLQADLFNVPVSELPPELAQNAELVAAWAEWKAHRKQLRHAMTPISTKKQVAEMVQWGPARSVAAIHHSIKQGYRGLFEPKTGKTLPPRGPITAENVLSLPKKQ